MENRQSHRERKRPSEKSFAWLFCAVFVLLAAYLGRGNPLFYILAAPGIAVLAVGYLRPEWLAAPNKAWHLLGIALHKTVSPVFLALIYLSAIIPVGLALRVSGKDLLKLKRDGRASTYWIVRPKTDVSMKNQF